jgi:hypothetical protein
MACRRAEEINLEVLFREPDAPECRDFVAHAGGCADCSAALEHRHEPPAETTHRTPSIAVAGAAVVIIAVIALLALSDRSDTPSNPAADATEERAATSHAETELPPETAAAIELPTALHLELGEDREIAAADLPSGRPFLLSLSVPIVTGGVDALPVRLIAEDGRVLEVMGAVAKDGRERAAVPIEANWLNRPGRYIVEVKTTEKTHMPLRRYAIEVR